MNSPSSLRFKIATEDWEFEAVHRLNYQTFVEEIAQHEENPEHRLVDKFHHENTYAICLWGNELVGMVAGRGQRPFSLDQKLPELDSFLPPSRRPVEVRLLSVTKNYRNGPVFCGLVGLISRHFMEKGYDLALISGTTRQLKLYKKLGFIPFGPLVGKSDALFQPMYLTLETFEQSARAILRSPPGPARPPAPANFLPGPVAIHPDVRQALEQPPVSHRANSFVADFTQTRALLCQLARARECQVFLGSGTMANDAVAAQLSLEGEPGLVLSNGEFGERLADHARRFGLAFELEPIEWGAAFDLEALGRRLDRSPATRWLWAVHCETSTGVLNSLPDLQRLCRERGIKLCLDCISSIGTVPVDLGEVYLASGVSGKGLGSFTGLSMVFYNHPVGAEPRPLPRYLDLHCYASSAGVPYTQSSNLLYALQAALKRVEWPQRFSEIIGQAAGLRARLRELGLRIVAADTHASPAVTTIALPAEVRSRDLGRRLEEAGYFLSYGSEYLVKRNWIQVCLMGESSREQLTGLGEALPKCLTQD